MYEVFCHSACYPSVSFGKTAHRSWLRWPRCPRTVNVGCQSGSALMPLSCCPAVFWRVTSVWLVWRATWAVTDACLNSCLERILFVELTTGLLLDSFFWHSHWCLSLAAKFKLSVRNLGWRDKFQTHNTNYYFTQVVYIQLLSCLSWRCFPLVIWWWSTNETASRDRSSKSY